MQVESLSVERRPSYDPDYAGMLVGTVKLKGVNGSQEIKLSNESLSRIFKAISDDVQRTAVENAALTKRSMADATAEPLLMAARTVEQLA